MGASSIPSAEADSTRVLAIIVYLLYLLSLPLGVPAIVGVVIAYIKRDEARGTVYESHYAAAIETFWVFLIGFLAALPLCLVLVGFALIGALLVWVIYRSVKGMVLAIEAKPYR